MVRWLNKKARAARPAQEQEAPVSGETGPEPAEDRGTASSEAVEEGRAVPGSEQADGVPAGPVPSPEVKASMGAPSREGPDLPRLYSDLASWWPLLSDPAGYAEEASFYAGLLREACGGDCTTVLELGSGGGNNALHMKSLFRMTLVDASQEMLDVCGKLNPECTHVRGDMRTIRLGTSFDGIFVHDAVSYMTSLGDLAEVAATAWEHCRPGGAVLLCPDYTAESFSGRIEAGGGDREGRSLRYLEWVRAGRPETGLYSVDFALMLIEGDSPVTVEHDTHVFGLFPAGDWIRVLGEAGFEAGIVSCPGFGDEPAGRVAFLGRKPLPPAAPLPPDPLRLLAEPPSIDWGGQG